MDLYLHNPTPNITGVLEETEIYRKSTQSPFQPAGVRGNWTLSSLDSPGHAWDGPWWSHGRINIWPSLSISFIVHFAQSKQTTAGCSKRRTCHLLVPFVESLGDSIPPPWCHVHHSPGSMPFNVAGPRKAQLCDAPLPSRANLEPSGAPGPRLTLRGRTWTEILRALGCLRYFFCKHHHSGASEPLLINHYWSLFNQKCYCSLNTRRYEELRSSDAGIGANRCQQDVWMGRTIWHGWDGCRAALPGISVPSLWSCSDWSPAKQHRALSIAIHPAW